MQQKELYHVCTYIMTCRKQLDAEKPDRTWWTRRNLTHAHQQALQHNCFKISTYLLISFRDFFNKADLSCPLRACQVGLVSTIPSHGAVARSVAARAHTAFPACNLRLTFNLPSFINSTVNLSRRSEVNNQTPLLLFFNIHHQLLRWLST